MNLPNVLTVGRIVATGPIALLAALDQPVWAVALFALAGATDWLDGYLARKLNQTSGFGAMFDPIADKLQVGVVLGVLLWLGAAPGWHLLPVLAILAREIFVSGLREDGFAVGFAALSVASFFASSGAFSGALLRDAERFGFSDATPSAG